MSLSRRPYPNVQPGRPARQQLRKSLLQWREALSTQYEAQLTEAIAHQVVARIGSSFEPILRGKLGQRICIGVYWPIRGEPNLQGVYQQLSDSGYSLALPFIKADPFNVQRQGDLAYALWSIGDTLVTADFNIQQPKQLVEITPDLLLVPCVGFDINGYRLGYGAGFFDQALKRRPTKTMGIAFSQTGLADLHPTPNDVRLDAIVTELEVLTFSG